MICLVREKEEGFGMIYKTLDEAIAAAIELAEAMETFVKITVAEGGYELFGNGEVVEIIE